MDLRFSVVLVGLDLERKDAVRFIRGMRKTFPRVPIDACTDHPEKVVPKPDVRAASRGTAFSRYD